MDFEVEYTPEQNAFRQEVSRWLEGNVPDDLEHPFDPADLSREQYEKRRDLGRALGKMGWLYPSAPSEYGGGGLTLDKVIILEEEMQRIGLELPPYYDSGGRMGAPSMGRRASSRYRTARSIGSPNAYAARVNSSLDRAISSLTSVRISSSATAWMRTG